jgi:hypothetical protein
MDVQWTVVFSGLSAGRVELLEQFAQPPTLAHNATQSERVLSHSQWEQTRKPEPLDGGHWLSLTYNTIYLNATDGILGNPGEGTRPWMRFFLRTVQ